MSLEEARKGIDQIDPQIRELIAKRLDCSYQVAVAKKAEGSTTIYRADREDDILRRLGADVPEERRAEYLAVVRKIMETSRMYQYGLLYDWDPTVFELVEGHELADVPGSRLMVRLSRANRPNAMSAILSMIGDYGFNMERMELVELGETAVTFDLTILGDITQASMRKLIFQLAKESQGFAILGNE